MTVDIFSAIKTRCFSSVLFPSPGDVWGPLRKWRMRDPVSLASDLSGVMNKFTLRSGLLESSPGW